MSSVTGSSGGANDATASQKGGWHTEPGVAGSEITLIEGIWYDQERWDDDKNWEEGDF